MHQARGFLVLVALGLLAGGAVPSPVAFGQASTSSPRPATPGPAECRGEDRVTPEDLRRLAVTPVVATPAGPVQVDGTGFVPPAGTPADPTIVAAVTATVRELYACLNAGDEAAALAFQTDDAIRTVTTEIVRELGADPRTADYRVLAGMPSPTRPAARATVVAVRDVTSLPDGRVGAIVEVDEGPGARALYVTFVEEGGRYRIADPLLGFAAGNLLPGTATPGT